MGSSLLRIAALAIVAALLAFVPLRCVALADSTPQKPHLSSFEKIRAALRSGRFKLDIAPLIAILIAFAIGVAVGFIAGYLYAKSTIKSPGNVMYVEDYIVDASAAAFSASTSMVQVTNVTAGIVPGLYALLNYVVENQINAEVSGSMTNQQLESLVSSAISQQVWSYSGMESLVREAIVKPILASVAYATGWVYQFQRWQEVVYSAASQSFSWYWSNTSITGSVLVLKTPSGIVNVFTDLCGSSTYSCTLNATMALNGTTVASMSIYVGSGSFSISLQSFDSQKVLSYLLSRSPPSVEICIYSASGAQSVCNPVIELMFPSSQTVYKVIDPAKIAERALARVHDILYTIYRSALAYAELYRDLLARGANLPLPLPVIFSDQVASAIQKMNTTQLYALYVATLYALSKIDWSKVSNVTQTILNEEVSAVPTTFPGCIVRGSSTYCGYITVVEIGSPQLVLPSGYTKLDTWMYALVNQNGQYSLVYAPPGSIVVNQGSSVTIRRAAISVAFNLGLLAPITQSPQPVPIKNVSILQYLLLGAIIGGALVLFVGRRRESIKPSYTYFCTQHRHDRAARGKPSLPSVD